MSDAPICPETGRPMVRGARPFTVRYKDRSKTVDLPGWYSEGADESTHSKADMKVSDLALASLKAEADGVATPDEVRRIREGLGLSQAEASRLIGGGVRAFQKYESGEVQASRAMTTLLRMLERHPEEIDLLRQECA